MKAKHLFEKNGDWQRVFRCLYPLFLIVAVTGCGGGGGSVPTSNICGDGNVASVEQCDDGNKVSGDGCSSACVTETANQTVFAKTFSYYYDNEANSIQQISGGGYIVAGSIRRQSSGSDYEARVIKLDSSGSKVWGRTYDANYNDCIANSIQETSDGGYVVAGYKQQSYNYRFWVMKLDSSGDEEWEYTYNENEGMAFSIRQASDGGYIVAGEMYDYYQTDALIIKLDPSGTEEWEKTFGGSYYDDASSIIQTSDGSYVAAGTLRSSEYNPDFWVIKLSSSGSKKWEKTFGEKHYDEYARDILQTPDGEYIVVGNTGYQNDAWLIKIDSSGNRIWARVIGSGNSYDYANSIAAVADGGYVVAGYTESSNGYQAWLIKIDSNRNIKWTKLLGWDSLVEVVNSIQATSDGGFVIAGNISTSTSSYTSDIFVIKMNANGECEGCFD